MPACTHHLTAVSGGSPPIVLTLSPQNANASVPVNTTRLSLLFNENINKGEGVIIIRLYKDGSNVTLDVTSPNITIAGATVTITLGSGLIVGANYTVEIGPKVFVSKVGQYFKGISQDDWTFVTQGRPYYNIVLW